MKFAEMHPSIIIAAINAAKDISVAKVTTLKDYNTKHDFFAIDFERVVSAIVKESNTGENK